ncbi:MAG: alpha/beta fold hydrolase [Rhodobacterales bacterium]|nr:alpha/beta fold hydrolase [Rhodobacterales bacterium]
MTPIRLILAAALIAGCTPRGEVVLYPPAAEVGVTRSVFVGTTRVFDPATGAFTDDRLRGQVTFARYDVAVPPQRDLGAIRFPRPGVAPDPQRDFVTTAQTLYDTRTGFRRDLSRAMAAQPGPAEVTVFVHGFNNTFAEGMYRIAQLAHDLELPGVAVHYSWPSAASPLGYVYDRDSALFARDGLETLLAELTAAGAQRILLVAHSMGSALTMEALRQTAIRGNRRVLDRLSGVILMSPDLDVDVFHEQAGAIGRLPQPFVIFSSRRDRALALSARLTGQRERLGNLADLSEVADLDVTVLDVGAFSTGAGHFPLASSPALIRLLSRISDVTTAFDADQTGRTGLLPGVVLSVQDATRIILSPVTVIAEGAN